MLKTLCIGLTMNFTKAFMFEVTAKFACVCSLEVAAINYQLEVCGEIQLLMVWISSVQ